MTPGAAAERGIEARLVGDAALMGLLGTGQRVVPGWPADTRQPGDYPRITYFVVTDSVDRPGYHTLRVQLDRWVWPVGDTGGWDRAHRIDERLLALLSEQVWAYEGRRIYCRVLPGRDMPGGPGNPLRRTWDLWIGVH